MSHHRIINLEIPFSTYHVYLARKAIAALASSHRFTASQVDDITVAVGEACTNAVKHGCTSKDNPAIRVKCILKAQEICISISNSKPSNNPLTVPAQPDTQNENGYGLYLMNSLMDRVRIRQTSGHATVVMTKKLRLHSRIH